jgi:16S rRNA (uracil1498-N3)-methyltransferase
MRRFFVDSQFLAQQTGIIRGELYRHLKTVLRLKPGDTILLADGKGHETTATIRAFEKDGIAVVIGAPAAGADAADTPFITLYQGIPKGDRLDRVLQKCTELGVGRIVPFTAERSVSRIGGERLDKRLQRWERIVMEAARQSGRGRIPEIGFAEGLGAALAGETSSLGLLLWEDERERGLRSVLEQSVKPGSVAVIVGPEGGLTAGEAATATAVGFIPVTLGRRILRTETAGPAITAILQYIWGDLG